jgi:hypothetical protein
MSIMIDTPAGIKFFQLLSIRGRLQIETETGLRSRVSSLAAAKHHFGCVSNTKLGALEELDAMVEGVHVGRAFARGEMFVAQPPLQSRKHTRKIVMKAFERGVEMGRNS